MSELRKQGVLSKKVAMKFDMSMLNSLVKYVLCSSVPKLGIHNVYTLFENLDLDVYAYNQKILERINLIRYITDAQVNLNMSEHDLIHTYVLEKDPDLEELCNETCWDDKQLSVKECEYITKSISERLQYVYLYETKDELNDLFDQIDRAEFISFYDIVTRMKTVFSQTLVKLQNSAIANDTLIRRLNFADDSFKDIMDLILKRAKMPTNLLQTGMRQFNAILSPGFYGGRVYTILGLTGKFKSGTLLNLADQIVKYNPQVIPVEDGKRKTLLFITMENSINETMERLFDMYSDSNQELRECDLDEVLRVLRQNGGYTFSDTQGISIEMRYFTNLEIKTSNIYSIIQDMEDNGMKVIGLILDYLMQLDSDRPHHGDERLRLANCIKELKALAQTFAIPVITVMQINREGNDIIDRASTAGEQDVLRLVGASQIGQCWEIMQESDWVCVVNLERQVSTGRLFLTVKRLKIRGKKDNKVIDYFNHPFENEKEIRLKVDINEPQAASVFTLAETDLESADNGKMDFTKGQSRPDMTKGKKKKKDDKKNVVEYIDTEDIMNTLRKAI